jgi:hypothetical protein
VRRVQCESLVVYEQRCHTPISANKFVKLVTPFALLEFSYPCVKPRRGTRGGNLAQRRDGTERAPLKLGRAFQVLLDRVLADRRSFHTCLQQRRSLAQTLRDRGGRERRETEEGHVANDLDLILHVCESDKDVRE